MIIKQKNGFTLVELIVAMALLLLLVTAFVPLIVTSIQGIFMAGSRSVSLYNSQKTIEGHFTDFSYGVGDNITLVFSNSRTVYGRRLNTGSLTTFLSEPRPRVRFVAVGNSKSILTSTDGIVWNKLAISDTYHLQDIVWGGSYPRQFVTVGTFGYILTSSDGEVWTSRSSGTSNHINSLVWGGINEQAKFIAVGDNGTIITSDDGENWTSISSGISEHLKSVSWGSWVYDNAETGTFIATGNSGTILLSTDGITWQVSESGTTNGLNSVTWVADKFLIVGDNRTFLSSTNIDNNLSWTLHDPTEKNIPNTDLRDINWSVNRTLVATNQGIYEITSSLQWVSVFTGYSFQSVSWGYNNYISVGESGRLFTSDSGTTWTARNSGTSNTLSAVTGR